MIQRKTQLKRNTKAIPRGARPSPKRAKPRRGRLVDKTYLAWCAKRPCCVTNRLPAQSHHIREFGSPKNDHLVIRLVPELHLHEAGMFSIERLGKQKFEAHWHVDIMREAKLLYGQYLVEIGKGELP